MISSNSKWLFFLSIAPLLGAILQGLISNLMAIDFNNLFFLMLFLNFILVFLDVDYLKSHGMYSDEMGSPWIIPFYLYKRARVFNVFPIASIIWTISYLITLFIPADMIKEFVWLLTFYG